MTVDLSTSTWLVLADPVKLFLKIEPPTMAKIKMQQQQQQQIPTKAPAVEAAEASQVVSLRVYPKLQEVQETAMPPEVCWTDVEFLTQTEHPVGHLSHLFSS